MSKCNDCENWKPKQEPVCENCKGLKLITTEKSTHPGQMVEADICPACQPKKKEKRLMVPCEWFDDGEARSFLELQEEVPHLAFVYLDRSIDKWYIEIINKTIKEPLLKSTTSRKLAYFDTRAQAKSTVEKALNVERG